MERWFAVSCKSREELIAQENLLRQQVHVYLPRIHVKRWHHAKWAEVIEPLFPRYLSIQVYASKTNTSVVRSTRGVVDLVSFGGTPVVIDGDVGDALLVRESAEFGLHEVSKSHLEKGQTVRLVSGPLIGMEALFAQEDGEK